MSTRPGPGSSLPARAGFGVVLGLAAGLLAAGCGSEEDVRALANVRAPAPVAGLKATPGDQRVRLNWEPSDSLDLIAYQVYRAPASDGPYRLVGSVGLLANPWFEDEGADGNGDGRPDGLVNGVRLFYKVVGLDKEGFGGHLNLAGPADAVPTLPPGSFHDLQVENVRVHAGAEQVLLTWNPVTSRELFGYRVYREELGEPGAPRELAVVGPTRNHFYDGGVEPGADVAYLVAPLSREGTTPTTLPGAPAVLTGTEGRRTRSRVVTPGEPDSTTPLAPGHDPATGILAIAAAGEAGILLGWGRPIQNTDGSFFGTASVADDLIGGGYVVYRAESARAPFEPIGIIENLGSEVTSTYLDPAGTPTHVYMVRAFDRHGTLGDESRRVSAGQALPDLVRGVDAFASTSARSILLSWSPELGATGGYRIFRSRHRDRGFTAIADVPPQVLGFTDGIEDLQILGTFYYRVAPLSLDEDLRVVTGALSAPAAACPGPSDQVFTFEAEDALFLVGAASSGTVTSVERIALPPPWNPSGAIRIGFAPGAPPGASTFTLRWTQELVVTGPGFNPRNFEVFLRVVEDSRAPVVDVLAVADGALTGASAADGRLGLSLFAPRFGFPPIPTMVRIGDIALDDQNRLPGGAPVAETISLTFTLQGLPPGIVGAGTLVIDGLVLVGR